VSSAHQPLPTIRHFQPKFLIGFVIGSRGGVPTLLYLLLKEIDCLQHRDTGKKGPAQEPSPNKTIACFCVFRVLFVASATQERRATPPSWPNRRAGQSPVGVACGPGRLKAPRRPGPHFERRWHASSGVAGDIRGSCLYAGGVLHLRGGAYAQKGNGPVA